MSRWSLDDVPDLTGRVFVVTGANSGVGFETSRMLAERGATTILAGRSHDRIADARSRILSVAPDATIETLHLDLASLDSVREAAMSLTGRDVDVLVNNAGVMAIPRSETEEGFETQFGVNHLGHFAFTALTWPLIRDRVVTVTSLVHRVGRMNWSDLMGERRYRKWGAYFQSKLANVLFGLELHRRAGAAGRDLGSMLCHPGYAATNLQAVGPRLEGSALVGGVMNLGNATVAQSARAGAEPIVMAAVADLPSGSFTGPAHLGWRGRPRLVSPSAAGRDEASAARLWEISEELTGIAFDV